MNIQINREGSSTTIEKISIIEKKLLTKIPVQFKNFLLQHNGGHPFPNAFNIQWKDQDWAGGYQTGSFGYFFSVNSKDEFKDFYENFETFGDRIPADTLPIAYTSGGDLVLMGTEKNNLGKIYYWAHSFETGPFVGEGDAPDYSNIGFVADDFNQLLEKLYDYEEED